MAVITSHSLVLRGKPVTGDVATGMVRTGSKRGDGQVPARLSQVRHPSPSSRYADAANGPRGLPANAQGVEPAGRAGRPGSLSGFLACRTPASGAGRAVLSRRSRKWAQPRSKPVLAFGPFTATAWATLGTALPERSSPFRRRALDPESGMRLLYGGEWPGKRGGTLPTSTAGK
jgi:hypothetical protein